MNILQAKQEIKHAVTVYLAKDEFGNYVLPPEVQRPIFLIGAPGIGKTAIMEQIAHELNIGILSYSMTHHTRQSARGLPLIEHKSYGGKDFSVSEYTMSEIIAEVYEKSEEQGFSQGILFLDEINCVSETLTPAMLQFLQYKTFGRHRIPDGWIVVTAGNPPAFNRSAREFDIVTWDRVRRIDVEADYKIWRAHAAANGIHTAVLTYLDTNHADFYVIENSVDGKRFVTARSWFDLSRVMTLYEQHGLPVTEQLICQYLQHDRISTEFYVYYELFAKYRDSYSTADLLDGHFDPQVIERAKGAGFDERTALIGMLTGAVFNAVQPLAVTEQFLLTVLGTLREAQEAGRHDPSAAEQVLRHAAAVCEHSMKTYGTLGGVSAEEYRMYHEAAGFLKPVHAEDLPSAIVRYRQKVSEFEAAAETVMRQIGNAISFAETCFGSGQELLLLITELSVNPKCAHLIDRFGCEKYYAHSRSLLVRERMTEVVEEIRRLGI